MKDATQMHSEMAKFVIFTTVSTIYIFMARYHPKRWLIEAEWRIYASVN